MIVLDTNILCELMRLHPEPAVVAWLDRQPTASIWTTSLCVFEVRMGLSLLPAGRRRDMLQAVFQQILADDLNGRVLGFDTSAAIAAADIAGKNQPQGRVIELRDLLIAGTVAAHRGTLATRNVRHFVHAGVGLINPWDEGDGAANA